MKKKFNLTTSIVLVFTLLAATVVQAATYTKANNTNSLDQPVSWGGTAPGSGDVAQWLGTYSASFTNAASGAVPGPTNALLATFPGTPLSWQGLAVGALAGTALNTNTFSSNLAATNITAATEALYPINPVIGTSNYVTITTKANHAFAPGQSVTISGITPAGYNGTFVVVGVPSATSFTYSNSVANLTAGTAFGTVQSSVYMGGLGAATASSLLTIGTSGIDLSAANVSAILNAVQFAFSGNQTWNVAAGRILHFGASGTGAANAKAVTSGSDGTITISGGGVVDLNQGGASGFADVAGWTGFSGKWIINNGATLRGLRNGGTAFGANTAADAITLNGGTLAVGGISGDVGNWTWNTPITLAPATTSFIDEHNVAGTARFLKLNQVITGSGNLTFKDTAGAGSTFTTVDLGYILTGANDFSGTLTIGGPVENGMVARLSQVRIGGSQTSGTDVGTGTGVAGTLGTGNVVNNGVLTFLSSNPSMVVANVISGTGTLRIGSLNYASYLGATIQNVTLSATNTYTGPTLINSGTLTLAASGSVANSASITLFTNATFDVTMLASGFSAAPGQVLNDLGGTVNGNLNFSVGSTNLLVPAGSNTVGSLTINGNLTLSGGTNIFLFDINNAANDQISINGNLSASGVTKLQFVPPGGGLNAGTYTLITAANPVTAAPVNFSIAGLVAGPRPQSFSIAISGNTVQLIVVGSPGNLNWVGDGTANLWNTGTTSNWFNNLTSSKDVFYANDGVTFDDSGSNTPAINLVGSLTPNSVTVNASQPYTFGGAGQLAGATSLTVSGSGLLTLNNSNSFTGGVVLNSGTLLITNETALGNPTNPTPASLTFNGGTLLATNSMTLGVNTNRGITLTASGGTLAVTNAATLIISNTIAQSATASLTKSGNGTLLLAGSNTYNGGTTVQNGKIIYGNGQALGRGANTSGTSGFFVPPFELNNGIVELNGQFSYQPNFVGGSAASGTPVILYSGTLNFNGVAGGTMTLQDSGATPTGWGSTAATVLSYNEANNPGTANINARFAIVGTSASSTRTFTVGDSTATATEVNIAAPMGVLSLESTNQDGRNVTIIKNGAGTLQISAANTFPVMQVDAGTLRVNHSQALGADRSGSIAVSGGTGSPNLVIVTAGILDLNGFSPAIGGLSDNAATTGLIINNGTAPATLTLGASLSNTVFNASYSSVIADGTQSVSLNKIGTNIQTLAGINTYSGITTVSNGTLLVSSPGQIGLGATTNLVTVAGGKLGGSGTINAPVLVQAGGTLAPGASSAATETLAINGNLTLAGTNLMSVNKDTATNDLVLLTTGTVSYGGTLVVSTNLMASTTLALGDSFQLFSAPAHTGNFAAVAGSPGPGFGWSFDPASGVVTVVNGLASNPTNITVSVTGNTMSLSWPTDHLGWLLQSQTNALSTGLGTNWVDVVGSDAITSTNITINPANPTLFYRLRHP